MGYEFPDGSTEMEMICEQHADAWKPVKPHQQFEAACQRNISFDNYLKNPSLKKMKFKSMY